MPKPIAVLISVGANIEPEQNIMKGLQLLDEMLPITGVSTFYRTAPIDRPEQPPYLNGVIKVETALNARTLKFDVLRSVEEQLGRVRQADRYAARPLDLDIVLYGDAVIQEEDLVIPDQDMYDRPFIAAGVLELMPGHIMPDTGKLLAESFSNEAMGSLQRDDIFTMELRKRLLT